MNEIAAKIDRDPRFRALQKARSHLVWTLVGIIALAFYGYLGSIAFFPQFLARPLPFVAPLTVGLVYAAGLIVLCITLTCIYVRRANRDFDRLNRQIVADAERGEP